MLCFCLLFTEELIVQLGGGGVVISLGGEMEMVVRGEGCEIE